MSHQISFVVKTVGRPLTFSYPHPWPLVPMAIYRNLTMAPYSMSTPSLIILFISTYFNKIVHWPLRPLIPSHGLTPSMANATPLTANSTPLTANSTALTANQTPLTANLTDLDGFGRRSLFGLIFWNIYHHTGTISGIYWNIYNHRVRGTLEALVSLYSYKNK